MTKTSEQTERAILLAAEQEFMQRGYDGAKTMRIAEQAGVTHAMLHYYFRTKNNLFLTVLHNKMALLVQSVIDAFSSTTNLPLIERIEKGVEAHFDFVVQNPLLPRFLLFEVPRHEEVLQSISIHLKRMGKYVIENIQTQVDEEVKRGHFKPIQVMDLLLNIASLNVFPFLAMPLLNEFGPDVFGCTTDQIIENRKAEIKRVIRTRLLA